MGCRQSYSVNKKTVAKWVRFKENSMLIWVRIATSLLRSYDHVLDLYLFCCQFPKIKLGKPYIESWSYYTRFLLKRTSRLHRVIKLPRRFNFKLYNAQSLEINAICRKESNIILYFGCEMFLAKYEFLLPIPIDYRTTYRYVYTVQYVWNPSRLHLFYITMTIKFLLRKQSHLKTKL